MVTIVKTVVVKHLTFAFGLIAYFIEIGAWIQVGISIDRGDGFAWIFGLAAVIMRLSAMV